MTVDKAPAESKVAELNAEASRKIGRNIHDRSKLGRGVPIVTELTRRTALTLVGGAAAAVSMPFVKRAHAEDKVLNMYNWADYIGETTLEDFEKATGIKVTYDTYSSSEEMEAKMLAGSTGYDVVDMSGNNMPRFIQAGVFQKLDRSKLPGWGNQDPEVLAMMDSWDPGNAYTLPYMWGTTGVTFNLDMVKKAAPGCRPRIHGHHLQARERRQARRLRDLHSRFTAGRLPHGARLSRHRSRHYRCLELPEGRGPL